MKKIVVLGSTGSIGANTLEVAGMLGERVRVVGLSTYRNVGMLAAQIREHRPHAVAIADESADEGLVGDRSGEAPQVYRGPSGLIRLAQMDEADLVVNALVGASGIEPTLAAIAAGKDIALANKESLVSAGEIIVAEAGRRDVEIVPVDSEHSAIHQCIRGEKRSGIRRIMLTASGGPLIDKPASDIACAGVGEVLSHPTWRMGRKVTVDSATLLNKGFEVIEAHWLFGIDAGRIEVLVERKSMVHSLVEFVDGTVMGVLSVPDMRLPIQYALTYPDRVETGLPKLNLNAASEIAFEAPDRERFPCLDLAYEAISLGGTVPAALSAADEVVVESFLDGSIGFGQIYPLLRTVVRAHQAGPAGALESVMAADRWARREARRLVGEMKGTSEEC